MEHAQPNMKIFEEAFYEPSFQDELKIGVDKMLQDYVFLIGEMLVDSAEII